MTRGLTMRPEWITTMFGSEDGCDSVDQVFGVVVVSLAVVSSSGSTVLRNSFSTDDRDDDTTGSASGCVCVS